MEVGESKRKVSQGVVVSRVGEGGSGAWISCLRRSLMDVASCSPLTLKNSHAGTIKTEYMMAGVRSPRT